MNTTKREEWFKLKDTSGTSGFFISYTIVCGGIFKKGQYLRAKTLNRPQKRTVGVKGNSELLKNGV